MFENLKGYGSSLDQRLALKDVRASGARGYNMAKITRLTNDWGTFAQSFNYDISMGGAAMVARARDLARNDPYAKKILRLLEKNVVGPDGFIHRNKSGEYQKVNGEAKFVPDKFANTIIQNEFWNWSKKQYCTVSQKVSFRRLCQQAISTVWRDGEIFFKLVKGKVNKYGFALQPVESIYVDHRLTKDLGNGNIVIMGIEVDQYRTPVAYWFRKNDPRAEVTYNYSLAGSYIRIPANEIIHLFIEEVPGQIRGITQFAPSGIRNKMLYDFEENSLMRSKASSRVPGVIQKQANALAGELPGIQGSDKDEDGNWLVELEEGEFLKVQDGYELKNLDSDYPHQLHKEFTKVNLRGISAGNDVGYSSVSNDYESVTWHSGKLEKMDERDGYKDLQMLMTENLLEPVSYEWLRMSLLSGALPLPVGKLDKFHAPVFIGRRWEYTNPKEEVDADITALSAGIKSFEEILASRGKDIDDHLDQLADEAEKIEKYAAKGVKITWSKETAPAPPAEEKPVETEPASIEWQRQGIKKVL